MVFHGEWRGEPVIVNLNARALTISTGPPDAASVVAFDRAGRLWSAFLEGVSFRRGLDGRIIARWRPEGQPRQRRWLPADEARAVESRVHQAISALYRSVLAGEAVFAPALPHAALEAVRAAIAFDAARSAADAARYHEIYLPVGILPPDQYMAVVLQATEGCSFNTCTFCDFYKDRPFRIRQPAEFHQHAQAVRSFLGAGLSLHRGIFLADANALVVPMKKLMPLLDVVHETFDVQALGGLFGFLDGFSGEKKSAADYRALRERGLRRVYIGLESGSDDLLRFLRKPGEAADAVVAVSAMKAAGVAVGIIVLLGAGGEQYSAAHVEQTSAVLNAMPLDKRDILYFSELVVSEGLPYAADAASAALRALSAGARAGQQEAIEARLRVAPHISRYDIREFMY